MESDILVNLGKSLKKYRLENKLTQEQLAEVVGIHPTYVGKLECGKNNPSTKMLYKLSRALNKTIPELFYFDKINK